jgi:hypothetical protein
MPAHYTKAASACVLGIVLLLLPWGLASGGSAAGPNAIDRFAPYYSSIRSGYELALGCEVSLKVAREQPHDEAFQKDFIEKCKRYGREVDNLVQQPDIVNTETWARYLGWQYRQWIEHASGAKWGEINMQRPPNEEFSKALTNKQLADAMRNLVDADRQVADALYVRMQLIRARTSTDFPLPLDQICTTVGAKDCIEQRDLVLRWRERMKDCVLAPCSVEDQSLPPPATGYPTLTFLADIEVRGDFGAAQIPKNSVLAETYSASSEGQRYCGLILVNEAGSQNFDTQHGKLREACIAYDGRSITLGNVHREVTLGTIKLN